MKAALKDNPKDWLTLLQLGTMYLQLKDHPRAIEALSEAIEANPRDARGYHLRGDAYIGSGRHQESLVDYEKALEFEPDDSGVLNNMAWLLATSPDDELRDGRRAVALAEEACRLTEYKAPHILSTLAASFAESGDFETAIQWSTKAVEMANDITDDVRDQLKKELASYEEGKPWRERQTRDDDAAAMDDGDDDDNDDESDDDDKEELSKERESRKPSRR